MKALSLWQPWATLWLLSDPDEKVFETRSWYTPYRGDLIVHAAQKRDGDVRAALYSSFFMERLTAHGIDPDALVYGALIGKVRLVDCQRMRHLPEPSERERRFGLWEPQRFAWKRGPHPELWQKPIPYSGARLLFEVAASGCCLTGDAEPGEQPLLEGLNG